MLDPLSCELQKIEHKLKAVFGMKKNSPHL